MTEKEEIPPISRDSLDVGSIHVEFDKTITFREIEFLRRILIAYKYTDSVLDEHGKDIPGKREEAVKEEEMRDHDFYN